MAQLPCLTIYTRPKVVGLFMGSTSCLLIQLNELMHKCWINNTKLRHETLQWYRENLMDLMFLIFFRWSLPTLPYIILSVEALLTLHYIESPIALRPIASVVYILCRSLLPTPCYYTVKVWLHLRGHWLSKKSSLSMQLVNLSSYLDI